MAETSPLDLPIVEPPASPCCQLRNKGMYVYSESLENETEDDYAGTNYWCCETMKTFGPDDGLVGGRECRDPSRTCYQPL